MASQANESERQRPLTICLQREAKVPGWVALRGCVCGCRPCCTSRLTSVKLVSRIRAAPAASSALGSSSSANANRQAPPARTHAQHGLCGRFLILLHAIAACSLQAARQVHKECRCKGAPVRVEASILSLAGGCAWSDGRSAARACVARTPLACWPLLGVVACTAATWFQYLRTLS